MSYKCVSAIIVLVALVVAILGVTLPMNHLNVVMLITNFFDIMLPILAVGALIKYLLCCKKKECCNAKENCGTEDKGPCCR